MDFKMSKDAAFNEIKGWCQYFGEDAYTAEDIESSYMLKALRRGLIVFDDDNEVFEYSLMKPVELQNGDMLTAIKVQEPDASYRFKKTTMRVKAKGGRDGVGEIDIDDTGRFLSAATGQPIGILQRIKNRDYSVLMELSSFFG